MSTLALFAVLLTATLTSFSGFGSLPQVREDLVLQRGVLTDDELNRAVLVARTTPGPMGVYVVSVGYEVAGIQGAMAGWLALAIPALLVIPVIRAASAAVRHRRVQGGLDGLILASAALIISAGVPLIRDIADQWRLAW